MKKFLILAIVFAFVGVNVASATSTSATTTATTTNVTATSTTVIPPANLAELDSLLQQMKILREKIIAILIQNLSTVQTKSEKIVLLQSMLSQDRELYPEGAITGTMGNLTKNAIIRFINKKSLAVSTSTNVVLRGPAYLLQNGAGNSGKVPQGLLTAPGIAKKLSTTSASSSDTQGRGLMNKIKNLFKTR